MRRTTEADKVGADKPGVGRLWQQRAQTAYDPTPEGLDKQRIEGPKKAHENQAEPGFRALWPVSGSKPHFSSAVSSASLDIWRQL